MVIVAAPCRTVSAWVLATSARDALHVHPVVLVEPGVLAGRDRLLDEGRHLGDRGVPPVLLVERPSRCR
jgi:hypothetical protein